MRIATWNIGDIYNKFNYMELVLSKILELSLDTICFQEYLTDFIELDNYLLRHLSSMPYMTKVELSESHIVKNHKMGLSIISRYPIETLSFFKWDEEKFATNIISGQLEKLHTKGFEAYSMYVHGIKTIVINGHSIPFHRYGMNTSDHWNYYEALGKWLLEISQNSRAFVCGDFNTEQISYLLPQFANRFQTKTDGATHKNKIYDYIFFSPQINCVDFHSYQSESDHSCCFGIYE